MKKYFLLVIITLILVGGAGAAEPSGRSFMPNNSIGAAGQIAFVDLERVFNEFYKTKLSKARLELQKKDINVERQILVDEQKIISDEVDTLRKEARDTTLAEEIRDEKRVLYEERLLDLREKQTELEEFVKLRESQMKIQIRRMSESIMDEIRQGLVNYAKEEGWQAIIDSSSRRSAVGIIVYTRPDVDVTEEIIARLNSQQPENLPTEEDVTEESGAETEPASTEEE